ncbi:MAG: GNAT family N-acetyltransferase, partial [Desulfobacteraceae bacterium]|nr:GNAT family N-acetyltransferase [Desulfobacteraceae bacterium]
IDDDATIRYLINEFVEMAGYYPIVAASAEEAIALLEKQRFDVAISDIMLPGMDGLELTALIKKNYDTDVIVITGYSGEYSYEEAVDRGASDFVFKPVRFEELLLRLRRVLKERQMKKELHRLAITDGLTKLCNSRHFYKQLKIETERSARYGHPLSLLMLDIDYFKNYNDTYGHLEGDKVLSAMGRVIRGCLRTMDSAYRYGGEEFTVILPETDSQEAEVVADRIRKVIEKEIFEPKENLTAGITVSIGITEHKAKEELPTLIKRADKAMYESKQKGRNRITVLTAEKSSESENAGISDSNSEFSVKNVMFGFLTHPTQHQIDQIAAIYQLENWWEPTDTCERVARIISGSHCFMVVTVGDEIIGMGRSISDRANDAYIQDVALKKEYRGQGFGTKLVSAIVQRLETDGLKWIGLIAEKNSRNFYTPLGFRNMKKAVPMVKMIV